MGSIIDKFHEVFEQKCVSFSVWKNLWLALSARHFFHLEFSLTFFLNIPFQQFGSDHESLDTRNDESAGSSMSPMITSDGLGKSVKTPQPFLSSSSPFQKMTFTLKCDFCQHGEFDQAFAYQATYKLPSLLTFHLGKAEGAYFQLDFCFLLLSQKDNLKLPPKVYSLNPFAF